MLGLDELDVLAEASEDPQAILHEGAAQAIADDGTAYGLDVQDGQLLAFAPGQRTEPEVTEWAVPDGETQLTVVGNELVSLTYDPAEERLTLQQADSEPVDLTGLGVDGATARLQTLRGRGRGGTGHLGRPGHCSA